jgi:membrane protease YdiL (CAAX protease family)
MTKDTGSTKVAAAWTNRVALAVICFVSLGLVTTTNRAWYYVARRLFPGAQWLAETCIASFIVCVVIYLSIRPARPFALPRPNTNWSRIFRVSAIWMAIWLSASAMAAIQVGHWISYTTGAAAISGFLIFGPIQEELLFRGAIFELVQRVFPVGHAFMPILVSSVFFSLHHFELHHYQATEAALQQVAFTFPMGLVFGVLRSESGSLWPGLAVHFLSNLPGCFGK